MNKVFTALLLLTSLTGCQATQRQNATTGEAETNATTKGALIGAVTGVAVGLATGNDADERRKRALLGAGAGGAIGGGVGYYFDKQEAALREELKASGVQVKRVGENQLVLVMENGIGFNSGDYNLDASLFNTLNGVARILVEYPDTLLQVNGYTDSVGSEGANQTLSEQRANSVRHYLVNQNVASGRIFAAGYGERYPICDNNTATGRACNRRVEISIQPL
jgi:outer membrane protein OmpA-like peptidoglycan-associated protein